MSRPPNPELDSSTSARTELASLTIRDFRNFRRLDIELPPDGMVLVGENGQGKSNFLEAIRYLTLLRSARGARDVDLVRHGENTFFIGARARLKGEHELTVGFDRSSRRKKVQLDGTPVKRLSKALGRLAATMFSPSDVDIVSGGPAERRRYVDVLLSMVDKRYLSALQYYRSALAFRNAALRSGGRSAADEEQVLVWEIPMSETGHVLWNERLYWCDNVSPELDRLCRLMGETAQVSIEHVLQGAAAEPGGHYLLGTLERTRDTDIRNRITTVGPHRDELRILIDGREARVFASEGQRRTIALALRFLEMQALRDAQHSWPVLLLDDPFAELDAKRAERILEMIEQSGHGQVILAVPRESDVPSGFARLERWKVDAGELSRIRDG